MDDEKILEELNKLIQEGKRLQSKLTSGRIHPGYSHNKEYYPELIKWEYTVANILKLRFGNNSDFLLKFNDCIYSSEYNYRYCKENVGHAVGALEFIYDSLSKGFTEDLFYQRELILFGDLIEQAEEFLEKGHRIAAAIYGRIVLETTVREFAKKKGLETDEKFDQLIILTLSDLFLYIKYKIRLEMERGNPYRMYPVTMLHCHT